MDDFAVLMRLCAPWSWLLLASQVVILAIVLERGVFLCLLSHLDVRALAAALEKLVREGQVERAQKLGRALPLPWALVLDPGLRALGGDPACVRDAGSAGLGSAEPLIWKRFGRLGVAALAALAIGGLGTGRFLTQTPPAEVLFGLPLAWVPAAWGASTAFAAVVAGGLLALRAARLQRELRDLPRLLERLAYAASGS